MYKDLNETIQTTKFPRSEYIGISPISRNLLNVARMTVADNDYGSVVYLNYYQKTLYWILWVIILYVMSILLLNFIIAEACNSYNKVYENL